MASGENKGKPFTANDGLTTAPLLKALTTANLSNALKPNKPKESDTSKKETSNVSGEGLKK